MGPQFVAGMDPLTQQAIGMARWSWFLCTLSYKQLELQLVLHAYKAYMSPYQQDVIGTTLQEYDIQAQKGAQGVPAAAIAAGAFGGGREGVQRAEYQSASDRNRAALQAQLLQQGFGQAQELAAQALFKQMELAQAAPQLAGQQISALTTLGGLGQSQLQAQLSAQQQLSTTTSISTFINCTAIWFRNHGSNIRIPWTNRNRSISITYSIPKYIRCRCNTCWNI
jgi:hypothetical protein